MILLRASRIDSNGVLTNTFVLSGLDVEDDCAEILGRMFELDDETAPVSRIKSFLTKEMGYGPLLGAHAHPVSLGLMSRCFSGSCFASVSAWLSLFGRYKAVGVNSVNACIL